MGEIVDVLRESDPRRIGPYEVLGRLGAGGMGEVFCARSRSGLRLAVKVVRAEHAEDRTFRARFRQEVRAAQTVGGAGTYTARVVDADTEGERPWMATEFVEGPNLRDAIIDGGPLSEDTVLTLAAALGEALGAIHAKGMVHRDLKPSNILLAPDGPRVIDFGIVRALEATALTTTGTIVGSVGYVSPEQIRNGGEVGPPSDVFSLGAVLAYASTGREPFGEGQDSVVLLRILTRDFDLSAVPGRVRPLAESCLRAEAEARPTPKDVVAATGVTLRDSLRAGWFAPVRVGEDGHRWLPDRDSRDSDSRVEYLAPATVADAPSEDTGDTVTPARTPSRRRLLTAASAGVLVVGAGAGGALLLRDRDRGTASGGGAKSPSRKGGSASGRPTVAWQYASGPLFHPNGSGPCGALSPKGDVLYLAGEDGTIRAVGADGKERWARDHGGATTPTPPVVTEDAVYVTLSASGGGQALVAALSHDGKDLWRRELPGPSWEMPAATAGGLVVAGYGEEGAGGLYAYDRTGAVRWKVAMPGAPDVAPVVAGDTVYAGAYDNFLYAFDAVSGVRTWRAALESDVARPGISATAKTVVVSTNDDAYILYGLSLDGQRRWKKEGQGGGGYSTTVTTDTLALARKDTLLRATELASGKEMWSYRGCDADPAALGDLALVRSGAELHALGPDGTPRWTVETGSPGERLLSPVARGRRVYVPSDKGVAAVDIKG